LIIPSLVCFIIPNLLAMNMKAFKGNFEMPKADPGEPKSSLPMLLLGLGAIIFVPIFKTLTHLPPYVGMMLSLGVVATIAEIISNRRFKMSDVSSEHNHSPVHTALARIELPSILFFLGILMAVAALESLGTLFRFAETLNHAIPNTDIVVMLFGVGSAVVDNVPLVAASLGMFSQPLDDPIWHFIAFSAGTGGSMLIIGSAAGVVAMGMERIDFMWYLKNISWLAVIGFVCGCATFIGLGAAGMY
jgi:Na+/H+ antiporter NhaD/arsenite permease-like protein